MKNFIKENWFKLGVLLVLLFAVLAFVFYRQPAQTPGTVSATAETSGAKDSPIIRQFINNLPQGDVESQKCKELVSDMTTQISASNAVNSSINASKPNYSLPTGMLVDSKYIYSKKLCLANIDTVSGQAPNNTTTIQIFDLGSNEIFAEYDEKGPVNKDGSVDDTELFLWGKEQQKPFPEITTFWLALKDQF